MDLATQRLMQAAAGAGSDPLYVDDVFSTFLYKGNNSTNIISNGIDLAGEGGLVWAKARDQNSGHSLYDTERGSTKVLATNNSTYQNTNNSSQELKTFNNDGFTLGTDFNTNPNSNGKKYVSWTFRKAKGFFDVVTFTQASGTPTNQRISHSLGSAPGMIWMKCTSGTRDWFCYHRSLGKDKYFKLNDGGAAANATNGWGTSEPDATEFGFNAYEFGLSTGSTYVAYLFAHNDQSYGEEGDQSIIKCGTFNKNSGANVDVDLGWEPQFLWTTMYEGPSSRGLVDNMRGFMPDQNGKFLKAEVTNPENNTTTRLISAKGFSQGGDNGNWIYMAIRFPDGYVGKPPELGTDVFAMDTGNGSANGPAFDSNFAVDFTISKRPSSNVYWITTARLLETWLKLNTTDAAGSLSSYERYDFSKGVHQQYTSSNQAWMWKRHAGFDVVIYDGRQGGATVMNLNHNLGVIPEMIIIKKRNNNGMWAIYHKGVNGGTNPEQYMMQIDTNGQEDQPTFMNDTAPTATVFTVGSMSSVNDSGDNYIATLFSSIEGISKVGSYTGTGNSSQYINVGFGIRFLMIKRTDSSGDWMVFDSLRGFGNSGTNDSILRWNKPDAATSSNVINLGSQTFNLLTSDTNLNASGGKYIYYAHN